MRHNIRIYVSGLLLFSLVGPVASGYAANYPHDKTGRQFPAFLYESEEATEAGQKTQLTEVSSSDVHVKSKKKGPDNKGTKVGNVHTFTVDTKEHLLAPDKDYVIVYYLDDEPVRQYESVKLPFSFTWDYRGHRAGSYTVKIDIEDLEGNLLATQSTHIVVTP